MTVCRRTLELPYEADDLFDLVSDVRRYPEFVRWLRSLKVLSESNVDGHWKGRAEAVVGFRGFSERFTTDIDACRSTYSVDVSLVRGPFRRLSNSWRLEVLESGTRVEFVIDFEFRNFVLQGLAAANLDYAVRQLIGAFSVEAARRYQRIDSSGA